MQIDHDRLYKELRHRYEIRHLFFRDESLITVFFETYAQIDEADQLTAYDEYRKQYPQGEAQFMKWMTSFERVGYEKGLAEGKVEGFEEGIEKGIEEGVTKVAANLIAAGQSNAFITEVTGLSDAEIDKLRTMH